MTDRLTETDPVATEPDSAGDAVSLFCARCAIELQPGSGHFYRVTIEAVADPTPPVVSAEELEADLRQKIKQLLTELEAVSTQEALDQVYRRLILYLCGPCYRQWIENPTG